MVTRVVRSTAVSAQSPDALWPRVSDFAAPWHPMVADMALERASGGRIIRAFHAGPENQLYREELTYQSDSDCTYAYRLLGGIEGASAYQARLKIAPSEGGSVLSWHAEFDAAAARADDIASGTEAIFEAGLAAIADLPSPPPGDAPADGALLARSSIGQTPRLGLTAAPSHLEAAETLCLFLHGIGGNRSNWEPQLTALGKHFPLVAMDLRGYGDSTLGFAPSSIDAYCEDILEVAAHYGAKRLVLVGLSYGSWIATSFAMRHPEMLAGLVLCGGCTGMSEADPDEREAFRVSREVPMDAGQTPADFAPAVVEIISGPNADAETREILQRSMAAIPPETYRDALNCFCNPLERFDFGRIACPVLLMTGAHDRLAPPDEIRTISHRIHEAPGRPADAGPVRFEVIAGAGHLCNIEAPAAVNRHLMAFFQTLGLPRPTRGNSRKAAARAEKHDRILAAALSEFAESGYAGTSMEAIAKRAGVSKPTLYQYFGQKEDLFSAILESGRRTLLNPFEGRTEAPMVETLWNFARTYAGFVLSPDILALARVVIGEAGRMPDLAQRYYDSGPGRAFNGICRYVQSQKDAGRLQFDDCATAAEHLWSLVLSAPRTKALHFPHEPISQQEIEASVRSGLTVFLTAYSTHSASDLDALAQQNWRD